MKCTEIFVTDGEKQTGKKLEEFTEHEQANSPLGRLILALVRENAWSNEYSIWADLATEKPHLIIRHPTFVRSLELDGKICAEWSVRDVEDTIRTHLSESQEWLRPQLEHLQEQVHNLHRTSEKIMLNKAKAAIVAVFPESVGATLNYYGTQRDLYSFSVDAGKAPSFVVREIDHEFSGGVARIDCNSFEWYQAGNGIAEKQRHGLFWTALAIAFAAHELKISEDSFYCLKVFAEEKPWLWPQPAGYDPHIVKEVLLRTNFGGGGIYVKFGGNNLPAVVVQVPDEEKLFDV